MVTSGVAALHVLPGPRNSIDLDSLRRVAVVEAENTDARRADHFGILGWFGNDDGPVAQLVRAHP